MTRGGTRKYGRDTVFVLHMMGNHGPAYYKRYPPQSGVSCRSARLRNCASAPGTRSSILRQRHPVHRPRARIDGAHAQRLITSHGRQRCCTFPIMASRWRGRAVPARNAVRHRAGHADEVCQWSPGCRRNSRRRQCRRRRVVQEKVDEDLSHDNLFHSVLGVLDVQTSVYRPERDFFEGCRRPRGSAYARNPPR